MLAGSDAGRSCLVMAVSLAVAGQFVGWPQDWGGKGRSTAPVCKGWGDVQGSYPGTGRFSQRYGMVRRWMVRNDEFPSVWSAVHLGTACCDSTVSCY